MDCQLWGRRYGRCHDNWDVCQGGRQRVIFWVVMPAALALMSFPVYAPLFD
ncbi:hypothetical protein [Paraburkholderia sediminicola]|uniref:hypothetical protein n=1 Tax=Paraburkholderia sediminicola TaxID=458836 RepID=UPI0038BA8B46